MRVLAFRHVPFEGLGLIEPALASRGIAFDYAELYRDAAPPDLSRYDGLIVLGGPMSVNDPLPYLNLEMRAIESAIAADKPVLGVCLGAQLVARTLGSRVYPNAAPEIGWYEIELTKAADKDSIFADLNPTETVFHWHSDTFDLPGGAELLARSERTDRQAFRYGQNTYGLQFHLEVTPPMIVNWCEEEENCGDVQSLSGLPDPLTNRNRLDRIAQRVFGGWSDLLARRQK